MPGAVIDCSGDADICWRAGTKTQLYSQGNGLASWYYYKNESGVSLRMFGLADVTPDSGNAMQTEEKVQEIGRLRFSGVDGYELSQAWQAAHEKMLEDILLPLLNRPPVPLALPPLPLSGALSCWVTPSAAQIPVFLPGCPMF